MLNKVTLIRIEEFQSQPIQTRLVVFLFLFLPFPIYILLNVILIFSLQTSHVIYIFICEILLFYRNHKSTIYKTFKKCFHTICTSWVRSKITHTINEQAKVSSSLNQYAVFLIFDLLKVILGFTKYFLLWTIPKLPKEIFSEIPIICMYELYLYMYV